MTLVDPRLSIACSPSVRPDNDAALSPAGCKGGICAAACPAVHALRAAAADSGRQGAGLSKGCAVRGARHLLCVSRWQPSDPSVKCDC